MISYLLDTHSIIWYLFKDSRLSKISLNLIQNTISDGNKIAISSISIAEIVYLVEKSRINFDALKNNIDEISNNDSSLVCLSFNLEIASNLVHIPRAQVPDFPDRIIASTALTLNLPLITRDNKIKSSKILTVW